MEIAVAEHARPARDLVGETVERFGQGRAVLDREVGWRDGVGKVAIQLVPAGIGATLARNQLGQDEGGDKAGRRDSVPDELFLMTGRLAQTKESYNRLLKLDAAYAGTLKSAMQDFLASGKSFPASVPAQEVADFSKWVATL